MKSKSSIRSSTLQLLQNRFKSYKKPKLDLNSIAEALRIFQRTDSSGRSTNRNTNSSHKIQALKFPTPGPGQYITKSYEKIPTFQYNNTPRFPDDESLLKPMSKSKSNPSFKSLKWTPQDKYEALKEQSDRRESKTNSYKLIRLQLIRDRKAQIQENLYEKFRKLDFKKNKEKYGKFQEKWTVSLCLIGACTTLMHKFQNRSVLKRRIKQRINWLCYMSIILGKFLSKLRQFRERKANNSFHRLLPSLMVAKAKKIRVDFKSRVTFVIDKSRNSKVIMQLIHKLKLQVLRIQRVYRNYIAIKQARILTMHKLWLSIYPENRYTRHLFTTNQISNNLIDKGLKKYISTRMKQYLDKYKEFFRNRKRIEDEHYLKYHIIQFERLLSNDKNIPEIPKINPPYLNLYSKSELRNFVLEMFRTSGRHRKKTLAANRSNKPTIGKRRLSKR